MSDASLYGREKNLVTTYGLRQAGAGHTIEEKISLFKEGADTFFNNLVDEDKERVLTDLRKYLESHPEI